MQEKVNMSSTLTDIGTLVAAGVAFIVAALNYHKYKILTVQYAEVQTPYASTVAVYRKWYSQP